MVVAAAARNGKGEEAVVCVISDSNGTGAYFVFERGGVNFCFPFFCCEHVFFFFFREGEFFFSFLLQCFLTTRWFFRL